MDVKDLLKTASTDSLYHLLASTLAALRTRGDVALNADHIATEHADISAQDDGFDYGVTYYGEANAMTAMEERDPPLMTIEQVAERLGLPVDQLATFLAAEMPDLISKGFAHHEGDMLIIDGGE